MGMSSASSLHGRSVLRRRRGQRAGALTGVVCAAAAVGGCSLWVEETLSHKPDTPTSAGGGGGATTTSAGGGATTSAGGGGQGGSGACELACPAEACCDGACADLQTSEAHCGACGNICAGTQACCDGQCTGDSDSPCCVDLDCPGGKICSGNTCIPPCEGGLVACAGQCVDLKLSGDHCGACGNDCLAGRSCLSGACAPAWVAMSTDGAPAVREHAAVTSNAGKVFVWGGKGVQQDLGDGGLYDPDTDTWKLIAPAEGAPSPRVLAAAAGTGPAIVVWGGGPSSEGSALGDGARYDVATGTWAGMSGAGAPSGRRAPVAAWTGSRVLIWGGLAGGFPVAGGALYDPASDSWTPVSTSGAPSARSGVAAVWSGKELYLFGGRPNGSGETNEGFAYDPVKDEWRPLPAKGAPSPRFDAFAAWAGGMLIVWGGESSADVLADGASYDPAADAWSPVPSGGAPSKRSQRAGWSGWSGATAARVVLFGGMDGGNVKTDGRLFDPVGGVWQATGSGAKKYQGGAGVWSGAELVVWSGRDGASLIGSGQRYKP